MQGTCTPVLCIATVRHDTLRGGAPKRRGRPAKCASNVVQGDSRAWLRPAIQDSQSRLPQRQGIPNEGNICYLNALLQSMFSCRGLQAFIHQSVACNLNCAASKLNVVYRQVSGVNVGKSPSTCVFKLWLRSRGLNWNQQQDPAEVFVAMTSCISMCGCCRQLFDARCVP